MVAEKADSRKALFAAVFCNTARALAAVALEVLSACSLRPAENSAEPPGSSGVTKSDGFTNFETEPVRPLALSADGRYLYALNTADDRLEIFDAQSENLCSIAETTVGLLAGETGP